MQYLAVAPKMQGLLDKLVYINTTILELPPAMQSAYTNLANAKTNLVRVKLGVHNRMRHMGPLCQRLIKVFGNSYRVVSGKWHGLALKLLIPNCLQDTTMTGSPSPGTVATNLTDFLSKMPSLEPLDSLIGNLSAAENVLYNGPNGFPTADTATLLTWLADVRWVNQCLAVRSMLQDPSGCTGLSYMEQQHPV